MAKKGRFFAKVGLGLLIFIAALFVGALVWLPNPPRIERKNISPANSGNAVTRSNGSSQEQPKSNPSPLSSSLAQSNAYPPETRHRDEVANHLLMQRVLEDSTSNSDPCRYLDHVRDLKDFKVYRLHEEMLEVAEDRKPGDPYFELILGPLKKIMMETRNGKLAKLLQDISLEKEPTLAEKAEYYAELVLSLRDFEANIQAYNGTFDDSYLMLSFLNLLREHPEAAGRSESQEICGILRDGKASYSDRKQKFEDLLNSLGLDGPQIGYDPNYKTNLWIQKKGPFDFNLKGSWLDIYHLL